MSARFEQAELLKKQYTDKYVVVKPGVAELRRFDGLTGVVKTVNMSCRALVLFDGPADIAWYDIDPAFLTVVDAPAPKKKASTSAIRASRSRTRSGPVSPDGKNGIDDDDAAVDRACPASRFFRNRKSPYCKDTAYGQVRTTARPNLT